MVNSSIKTCYNITVSPLFFKFPLMLFAFILRHNSTLCFLLLILRIKELPTNKTQRDNAIRNSHFTCHTMLFWGLIRLMLRHQLPLIGNKNANTLYPELNKYLKSSKLNIFDRKIQFVGTKKLKTIQHTNLIN